jgi:hypothetical protein
MQPIGAGCGDMMLEKFLDLECQFSLLFTLEFLSFRLSPKGKNMALVEDAGERNDETHGSSAGELDKAHKQFLTFRGPEFSLGPNIGYVDSGFSCYSSFTPEKCRDGGFFRRPLKFLIR